MHDNLITVEKLQDKLNKREPVFILDVRSSDQRQEWRIAESIYVDAYKQLNAGDETALDMVEVPKNSTVVTVCAAGRTSLLAAELLRRKGIRAYSLEGGMKAWNYAWNTAEVSLPDGVKIVQVRRPAKGVLSYVVGSSNEAIVIDASLDPEIFIRIAKDNGWKIKYVTDTHIHADFISRSRDLANACGAQHILLDKTEVDFPYTAASDGSVLSFGNASLEILYTPGHTIESITFKIDDVAIFTGDTLFTDGVGRPDLKADHNSAIQKSVQLIHSLKKLLSLPSWIMIFPAHTSKTVAFDSRIISSTVGELKEKELLNMSEQEFVDYTTTRIPPTPPNYMTIATLNKQGSYEGYNPADLEAGGNHCAIKY